MNEIRVLVQGIARDYAAFSAFIKRETGLLEENEPGTLLMEVFGDESTTAVVVHEVYLDADAFMQHAEDLRKGTPPPRVHGGLLSQANDISDQDC